jgi:uncharacterized protein (TIGR03067 family)
MQWYGVLFVAAGFLMGAGNNQTDSGQDELKMLQGTWTVVSFEANSEKAPEEIAKKMKLTVKGNNWVLERGGKTNNGTIKLDPSKNPNAFEAVLEDGDVVLGIYEIKGDALTMCWAGSNKERPAAFKSDAGKTLIVYKKAKSD